MKFPVLFRIFAVLNLIGFFIFGAATLFMTTRPAETGFFMLWIHWCVTIWLFASTIAWFFASRFSYHFLYSLAFLMFSACIVWLVFIWTSGQSSYNSEKVVASGIPAVILFYTIFLVVALFYRPVVSWTPKRFSALHAIILGGFVLIFGVGLYFIGQVNKSPHAVYAKVTFPDSAEDGYATTTSIKGRESIQVDFSNLETINALAIKPTDGGSAFSQLRFAKMIFSESKVLTDTSPMLVVEFQEVDGDLVAEFPEIKARRIQLFPLNDEKKSAAENEQYYVAGLTPVRFTTMFEKQGEDYIVDVVEEASVTDEGNGKKLSPKSIGKFYQTFFVQSQFATTSDWRFDYSDNYSTLKINSESQMGMYKLGFSDAYLYFVDAVKIFQEYEGYDYEKYLVDLSGHQLYNSKAKGYEYEGNGTKFNYINPDMISWAESTFIVEPGFDILGYSAQDFYNRTFLRFMRMSTLSYLYLSQINVDDEVIAYQNHAAYDDFYGPQYLSDRYLDINLDEYEMKEGWTDCSEFIGFWLRRKVDGTYDQCWTALRKIMMKYDKQWLLDTEANPIPTLDASEESDSVEEVGSYNGPEYEESRDDSKEEAEN